MKEMDEKGVFEQSLIEQFFQLGLMGIEVPEQYGGGGGTFFEAILAVEELSRVDPSAGVVVDVQNTLVNNALLRWTTEEQKKRYLPRMCTDTVGAYALSEAGSGSDAFALQTRAELKGSEYVLNGQKLWITNAKEAGVFILLATVDPSAGYKGITAFIVEKELSRLHRRQEGRQARHPRFQHVRADPGRLPRAERKRAGRSRQGLQDRHRDAERRPHRHWRADAGPGARRLGVCREVRAGAQAVRQERSPSSRASSSRSRRWRRRSKPARMLLYNCARMKDAGMNFLKEAAMTKLYCSQVAERVASLCVEIYGGYGFTKDYPVEKFFRDSKIGKIYEGTSNMQLQTIAKLVMGK